MRATPISASSSSLFGFVQLEFAGVLGLPDGRYLVRSGPDSDAERVLVVHNLGAARRHLVRGRKPKDAPSGAEPAPLPVTRVTVVEPAPLENEQEAAGWLRETLDQVEAHEGLLDGALLLLNRALHVQRAAATDPFVHEVGEQQAASIRVGYGGGADVVEGRWSDARDLPRRPARVRRTEQLRPQERLAAVLGGRDQVAACETLILRARSDLDQGRIREAALQVRVGLEALLTELDGERAGAGQAEDLVSLDASRKAIGEAANAALTGDLDERLGASVRETIETSERVLRRRRLLS